MYDGVGPQGGYDSFDPAGIRDIHIIGINPYGFDPAAFKHLHDIEAQLASYTRNKYLHPCTLSLYISLKYD